MKNLNKKYRCLMPFDYYGKHYKSNINENNVGVYDYNDAVIYGYNGKVMVMINDEKSLSVIVFGGGIYNTLLDACRKKVKILEEYRLTGEGYFNILYKDIDKVSNILKLKKQSSTPIGVLDAKNYTYWLRIMRNTNIKYEDKLKEYNLKRRKNSNC